jgi:hypothetical protein
VFVIGFSFDFLEWIKLLKEEIIKQKRLTIENKDISCFSHENIFTSLTFIQNHMSELFLKDEFKLVLDPCSFNQFRQIGVTILGMINYGLYYLDKVKYYESLLQQYDYKIKSEVASKKERYFFEKKADEIEYYFYLAKESVTKVSNLLNIIIPDIEILSENLKPIEVVIRDVHKKTINVFSEELVAEHQSVNEALRELNLTLKSDARLSYPSKSIVYMANGDFINILKLNRILVTSVFLPIILTPKLKPSKQKLLKKSFKTLLKLLNKLCKMSDIDSDSRGLLQNLFDLLITYFASDKIKQDISLNKDKIRFNNLSDNIISDFCIENIKAINLKEQDKLDRRMYKKFSFINKH